MSPTVGACSVATRNYLADARLAARSFLDHHPGARFHILVVDGDHMPPPTWTHRDVELHTPGSLGLDATELETMAAIYDPAELACALKPLVLRHVLDRHDVAVYLDGDVEVLAPMPELIDAAARTQVVLVPHVIDPLPRDGRLPDEPGILGAGMFNGGLLACSTDGADFLDWWAERLRRDCLNLPHLMLHGDQRWLDFVPVLFEHTILRDPTYDVAYWNLHERPTSWVAGQLCIVDRPVRCFHYSGLTDARPWTLSAFSAERPRVTLAELPAVARQCRGWLERRRGVDAEGDRALGYRWARTERGVPLDRRSRMLWRAALLAAEADPAGTSQAPPSPFAEDGGEAWEAWLREPAGPGEVGRYLQNVWSEAPHLQRQFPEVPGADRAPFLAWAASVLADGAAIPDAFRPDPTEADVTAADRLPSLLRRPPRPDAEAQLPIDDIDRVRDLLEQPPEGPSGTIGRLLDRYLAGRDRRSTESVQALTDAVSELAERVASVSDRVDRTNDVLHRSQERDDQLAEADDALRDEATTLGQRLVDVESSLAAARGDLDGALTQDQITAAILRDAEERLAQELDELRVRIHKLDDAVAHVNAPAEPPEPAKAGPTQDEETMTTTPRSDEQPR